MLVKMYILQEEREEEGREEREVRQQQRRGDGSKPGDVCMTKHLHILFSYFILQSHLIA